MAIGSAARSTIRRCAGAILLALLAVAAGAAPGLAADRGQRPYDIDEGYHAARDIGARSDRSFPVLDDAAAPLTPETAPERSRAGPPVRISVPDLGIDADVIALDLEPDGALPVPDNGRVVAWYSYGARPGERGNTILAGHVDWNYQPAVFSSLRDARPGQVVTLHTDDGRSFDYGIRWVEDRDADTSKILADLEAKSGRRKLTLVTCSGRFDYATRSYESRRVVRAILIGERA